MTGQEANALSGARWFAIAYRPERVTGTGESPWAALASLADSWWRRFVLGESPDGLARPLGVPAAPWSAPPIGPVAPRAGASKRSAAKPEALPEVWDPVVERTGGSPVKRRRW